MMSFTRFFELATGQRPYAYQRELGERAQPPAVLDVPTGAGKTHALIVSWLYSRRVLGAAPRRLVYALPMRTLVEQTVSVARDVRDRLGLDEQALAIRALMGGADRGELREWQEHPDRDQVLVGTIDMLLSRALNRGYTESRYQWPIAFGLLNNDCRWVFDEIQLMESARVTAAQLDGLRAKFGVILPCETIWASATIDRGALETVDRPALGDALGVPEEDRNGALARRLNATKTLERVDLRRRRSGESPRLVAEMVAERHLPETLSIVVLNRVDVAQQVYAALKRRLSGSAGSVPDLVLLHSRFRPPDRLAHMESVLAPVTDGPGRIVVATQVIEAGVDVSATLLATETAPFSSIVQRVGRCNRVGDDPRSSVLWLDRGAPDARGAAPYSPADIAAAREELMRLEGHSLSPATLETVALEEKREPWDVLRRRDLLDLFDTSPDLSGMDVDVARFIREDDDRSVFVFFRDLHGTGVDADAANQPPPERDELVSVPLGSLGDRRAWIYDPIDDAWKPVRRARPGATVMLAATDRGYDAELGWSADAKAPVISLSPQSPVENDAQDNDTGTFTGTWMSLSDHLSRTEASARELIDALGLDASVFAEAVLAAAALHDIGKAHEAFQEMLRGTADGDDAPPDLDTTLWAKSANRRKGHNKRRHFRHELASALALRSLDGASSVIQGNRELVEYLVAAHHGRVRCSIRPAPEERTASNVERYALGVYEGDELPAVETPVGLLPPVALTLACMELGGDEPSWTESACALRDDRQLGPFRLALLEALVRIADWRAS